MDTGSDIKVLQLVKWFCNMQLLKTESGFATGDIALSWFENVTSDYWKVGYACKKVPRRTRIKIVRLTSSHRLMPSVVKKERI